MKIISTTPEIEITPGIFIKNPEVVDEANLKNRGKKSWTHKFALYCKDANGNMVRHEELSKTLSLTFYGDKNSELPHSNRDATYTDGETEEVPDPIDPNSTITQLVQKDLIAYIMGGGDPWNDEGIEITSLGFVDYHTVQGYFNNNTPELEFNSQLPPLLVKLGQEVALERLKTPAGVSLKTLGFQF